MHSALQSAKVVSTILKSFNFDFSCQEDRLACLTLGLTSQVFLSSALDELWRELFDLGRLIKTIDGVKTIEFVGLGDGRPRRQQFLDRLLSLAEVQRLRYYSRRVQVFYHQDSGFELFATIDSSIISQIITLLPGDEPLFPSLRRLHLGSTAIGNHASCVNAFSTPHISKLFLSSRLQSVSFGLAGSQAVVTDTHSPDIWLFLQGISHLSPQTLQNLDLGLVLHPKHLKPCFPFYTRLEFLKLPTGRHGFETLQHIATLPNLLSLSVTLGDWKLDPEDQPPDWCKIPFKRLMILLLDANIESTSALLSCFCFPKLDKLAITHFDRNMVDEGCWESLVKHVSDGLPNLRSLKLDYRSRDPKQGFQPSQAFPWPCFEHLLCLPLLNDLCICAPKIESLSNDDFSVMAKSWPELVRLRIDTERPGDMDYRVLITVESNLPYLQSLVLSMDMPGAWTPVPPTTPHKLQHLQVPSLKDPDNERNTPLSMQEQCEIAAFLDTLFPELDVKSFYTGGEDRERSGLGPSMDKLVKYLQDAGKRRAGMVLRGIKSH